MRMKRCAIYTRKSTEEGLDQEFNSLEAQREACAAFILSQRHEGWRESRERYDDGGFSGGSMERPALTRLLADVEAGRIDVVVVYKVDRLTRALTDFARIIEIFDTAGVSFVSVTQQFNTTTSMGRLTLNVLLSFAQFEREVAAERIRDKIAASKRKGMWMGGVAPLGYDIRDKALVVNEAEAETVRLIFRRYLELGSVRALKTSLDRMGIRSKRRTSRAGRVTGGVRFSRGALYALLQNPLYVGEIAHRGERHPGRHEAIVERELWQATQQALADANGGGPKRATASRPARLLGGLLFDEHGRAMKPVSASRAMGRSRCMKTYFYYASRKAPEDERPAFRLPAREVEALLSRRLAAWLGAADHVATALRGAGASPAAIARGIATAATRASALNDNPDDLRGLVERIDLGEGTMTITISSEALLGTGEDLPPLVLAEPLEVSQSGRARPIVLGNTTDSPRRDPELIALVADARRWMRSLVSGEAASVQAISMNECQGKGRVSRILPLAYLAPDIAEAILQGRQPAGLTAKRLRELSELPLDWKEQRKLLGFPPR